jgi:hypothetical protein
VTVKRITPPYTLVLDGFDLFVNGLEDGIDFSVASCKQAERECSLLIETPPSTLQVSIWGKGQYRVFVWAI